MIIFYQKRLQKNVQFVIHFGGEHLKMLEKNYHFDANIYLSASRKEAELIRGISKSPLCGMLLFNFKISSR